ncbi:DUF4383 domain-containing protein [Arthrobacter sp. zg-Y820]|uniref:DUF4383 domain-containing protein n=1 Tax=unclassified Arthrobacter TaxID=235627 RepID=UPI001E5197FA|nr:MULTISPECIES: DUF4383 domain-containing protein [unclassified Arthrobacter]MCC9197404.1 DUF4383 domain-containing protein [Arthrobacter sp. zg-Y820]MDK1280270.1 DUF4383 domain-containing protein [Arthrobacter sp. zg.Y820]WIB09557.1 DUF4383 domain-containing protein [Arthrobacter sp. zg-Y820]
MSYPTSGRSLRRTNAQRASWYFGFIFIVIGVLGFVPGITSNYEALYFSGHTSEAVLLGVFQVSILHNIVHLLFGFLGLIMARTNSLARLYLLGGGAVYLLLFIYGLIVPHHSEANFVPLNTADNWLHLVLGVVMVGLGLLFGTRSAPGRTSPA